MKPEAILFDLDGTLLPMDQEVFIRSYFGRLAKKMAGFGYEPEKIIKAVYAGTKAMITNDGGDTNENVFWRIFCAIFGEQARADEPHFDAFYRSEFQHVKDDCGFDPRAAELICGLKARGYRVILATNPLFPQIATYSRIRWAGMEPKDFELVTTYENSSFCKPNPKYYEEIVNRLGLDPQRCLMVGNDVGDDMVARTLGMKTFLLTDCLINHAGEDIDRYPHGSFEALESYIASLEA